MPTCSAERLERNVAIDTPLWQHRQWQGICQFRLAARACHPDNRFMADNFPPLELWLVRHQRDVQLLALKRRMKMDAAGAAQLNFNVWKRPRKVGQHLR